MGAGRRLKLGVSVDGAGHHPAAWRAGGTGGVDAARMFTTAYLAEHVLVAERGGLDFVTLTDAFGLKPGGPDRVLGRLDAVIALAAVAPLTHSIGLVAVADTIHTEPFHLSKNIATLDHVSGGRGGVWPRISTTQEVADLFGRTPAAPVAELWAEAADVLEVVRRLWDSWEDDAVIRDAVSGRYLDRDKVHYVDFDGASFSVRGPSITPRSPQGQPLVVIEADGLEALGVAAVHADVVIVAAADPIAARAARDDVRRRAAHAGRDPDDVAVLIAIDALVEATEKDAAATRAHLDELAGPHVDRGKSLSFTGIAAGLADLVAGWFTDEVVDGALVRPAVLVPTLVRLVDEVVPLLAQRGVLGNVREGASLRERFGLIRPANRYAATTPAAT